MMKMSEKWRNDKGQKMTRENKGNDMMYVWHPPKSLGTHIKPQDDTIIYRQIMNTPQDNLARDCDQSNMSQNRVSKWSQ